MNKHEAIREICCGVSNNQEMTYEQCLEMVWNSNTSETQCRAIDRAVSSGALSRCESDKLFRYERFKNEQESK